MSYLRMNIIVQIFQTQFCIFSFLQEHVLKDNTQIKKTRQRKNKQVCRQKSILNYKDHLQSILKFLS